MLEIEPIKIQSVLTHVSTAYLDPGTGSMLLYFIMGIFATFIYSLKSFYYKLKSFIAGKSVKSSIYDLKDINIVFYSEGEKYLNVFLPVIDELNKRKIKCAYLTSDEKDKGLHLNYEYLTTEYIGKNLTAFAVLNHLKTKLVAMTTPQLDVLELRRSKDVIHYAHIIHAPTDALLYKKFAFDYFDSVLCSGPHQIESIKALEKRRDLPPKLLLKTGLTYYDVMLKNKIKYNKINDTSKPTVLIAPTWGKNSMLEKFSTKPINTLLNAGFKVILRPHPQSYISQKELMQTIEEELSSKDNCEINTDSSAEKAMGKADIMISDISGIIFDFLFIYEKPVILLPGKIIKDGFEAEDLDKEIWECRIFNQIATTIEDNQINKLPEIVKEHIANKDKHIQKISETRQKFIFNFGKAGITAANQLIEILESLK